MWPVRRVRGLHSTSRMSVTLPALGPLVLQILLLTCDVHAQGRRADDSW